MNSGHKKMQRGRSGDTFGVPSMVEMLNQHSTDASLNLKRLSSGATFHGYGQHHHTNSGGYNPPSLQQTHSTGYNRGRNDSGLARQNTESQLGLHKSSNGSHRSSTGNVATTTGNNQLLKQSRNKPNPSKRNGNGKTNGKTNSTKATTPRRSGKLYFDRNGSYLDTPKSKASKGNNKFEFGTKNNSLASNGTTNSDKNHLPNKVRHASE